MTTDHNLESMIQKAGTPIAFLSVLYAFPPGDLTSENAMSLDRFILLFLVPAGLGIFAAIFGAVPPAPKIHDILRGLTSGLLIGISTGYGFLSLVVLYSWQLNPGNGHSEPIFTALCIAAASAEVARRLSIRDLING